MSKIEITDEDILFIIDPQRDFVEGGALAVTGGLAALGVVQTLVGKFKNIVISQDWHPSNHGSFASNHKVPPFSIVQLDGADQVAWPDHCVQGTRGAELLVEPTNTAIIIRKGMDPKVDSYSAFYDNGKRSTGLGALVTNRWRYRRRLFFVGLARDYCVGFSMLDAANDMLGSEYFLIEDATAKIADDSSNAMTERLTKVGATFITSGDIA
jgi:nicotinamidase/pyrazinamidase